MKKILFALPIIALLSVPVHAETLDDFLFQNGACEEELKEALDIYYDNYESKDVINDAVSFYNNYSVYEGIISQLTYDDWADIKSNLDNNKYGINKKESFKHPGIIMIGVIVLGWIGMFFIFKTMK